MKLTIVKVLISIILIGVVMYVIGLQEIAQSAMQIGVIPLLIALVIILLVMVLFAVRMYVLVRAVKRIPFKTVFRDAVAALCLGTFSPGKIGELSFVYSLTKEKVPAGSASAIFIIDRVNSLLTIAFFALLGVFVITPLKQNLWLIVLIIVLLITGAFMVTSRKGISIIKKLLMRSIREKFVGYTKAMKKMKGFAYIENLALNILNIIIRSIAIFILLLSLKEQVPFILLVAVNGIMTLASLIPISLSGLGVREGGAILLLHLAGLGKENVAVAYIFISLATYVFSAILLLFFVKTKKSIKPSQLMKKNG
ncbi:flippase-like domain-containing protein [Candidatus Woesearchaeota archaeon]|nr:flippase-like domain-containing protein [Candidatus Woesearchaeota archaeon]